MFLWNPATGKRIQTIALESRVESIAFSRDGKSSYLLAATAAQRILYWDVSTGQKVRTPVGHTAVVNSITVSPDGRYVLTGSYDATAVLWDVWTGAKVRTFGAGNDLRLER